MTKCIVCQETELTGKQKKYCSVECSKVVSRQNHLKRVYNLTQAQYDTILSHQDGRCAICSREPWGRVQLVVDHEHDKGPSGRVRGIICGYCNLRVIGRFKDAELLYAAADYLKRPPAIEALGAEIIAPGRPGKKRQPRKRRRSG